MKVLIIRLKKCYPADYPGYECKATLVKNPVTGQKYPIPYLSIYTYVPQR
jgi:hypothetical protein